MNRDTRPNQFYPTTGTVFDFTSDFFSQALGSKFSFQSYKVTFNKYSSLDDKQTLAYNAYSCTVGGKPTFYENCIYGTNSELRGYTAGRYLDACMVATQLEYRLVLPKKFGLVAFGGKLRMGSPVKAGVIEQTAIQFCTCSKKRRQNVRTLYKQGA